MTNIVVTELDRITDLPRARWVPGIQGSCEPNIRKLGNRPGYAIRLIGGRDLRGGVSLYYAVTPYGKGRPISPHHIDLALYFDRVLRETPPAQRCEIGTVQHMPADLAHKAYGLIALQAGAGLPLGDEDLRSAVNSVNATLGALGVPVGGWTFVPLVAAYLRMSERERIDSGRVIVAGSHPYNIARAVYDAVQVEAA
ncbi:MAG: hypothetical protein ACOZD0_04670 [Pseudomonadota bacterium]